MPRRARLVLDGVPLHIVHRGNNRQVCFHRDADYLAYRNWLSEYADAAGCSLHAYVLMSNHVHFLASFSDISGPALLMKALAQRYSQYFNWWYKRSGTVWEGRYHSSLVDTESYVLACHRYVEQNPLRAGMVTEPASYRWSSYRGNAGYGSDSLLTSHELYSSLGSSEEVRQRTYRALCADDLDPMVVKRIRESTRANRAMGYIAKPRGRPAKTGDKGPD